MRIRVAALVRQSIFRYAEIQSWRYAPGLQALHVNIAAALTLSARAKSAMLVHKKFRYAS